MQNTTTERLSKERSRIYQRRMEAASGYRQLFADMIAEWNSPKPDDRGWLTYSANYIFRTAGVRWALDPMTLRWRVPEAPAVDIYHAFDHLEFVLLTHRHGDHLDFELLRSLRRLPIRWVIPEFILGEVQAEAALPVNQIIVPHPLQQFNLCGIQILPFEGLH